MAELALGLVGAAATVGGAALTTGSGFTGRHESSHREERMETRRNMADFVKNRESGDVTPDEEAAFLETRDEAIRRQNEYYESIESYKEAPWSRFLNKLKKRQNVRKAKRLTRQSNHSLRSLNESMYSGSDRSSIYAESGSPPGSNLAMDNLQDWRNSVDEATGTDIEDVAADEVGDTADGTNEEDPAPAGKINADDTDEEEGWSEDQIGGCEWKTAHLAARQRMDDTDPSWCAVCDRLIVSKRIIAANPPPSPQHDVRHTKRGGLVRGTGRVRANGTIKHPPVVPSPRLAVKTRVEIDQSPTPLYCSDNCRQKDLAYYFNAFDQGD